MRACKAPEAVHHVKSLIDVTCEVAVKSLGAASRSEDNTVDLRNTAN